MILLLFIDNAVRTTKQIHFIVGLFDSLEIKDENNGDYSVSFKDKRRIRKRSIITMLKFFDFANECDLKIGATSNTKIEEISNKMEINTSKYMGDSKNTTNDRF